MNLKFKIENMSKRLFSGILDIEVSMVNLDKDTNKFRGRLCIQTHLGEIRSINCFEFDGMVLYVLGRSSRDDNIKRSIDVESFLRFNTMLLLANRVYKK